VEKIFAAGGTLMLRGFLRLWIQRIAGAMGIDEIAREVKRLREICTQIQYQVTVAPDGLPLPPPQLHSLISGNSDLGPLDFLEIGENCAKCITTALNKHNLDISEFHAVLDFGCGCGRVMRHFHSLKIDLYGVDYNAKLIDWCKRNLPFANFEVNELQPPLAFSDAMFDLIYAFSVFTHLRESDQVAWLAELSRTLKPGGYLLLTTHGKADAEAYLPSLEKEQFRAGRLVVLNPASYGENRCNAFHPPEYVKGILTKGFDVLDFVPGAVVDAHRRIIAQDIYFLRKPTLQNKTVLENGQQIPA
jgi:SAM-dependent methyltransferase